MSRSITGAVASGPGRPRRKAAAAFAAVTATAVGLGVLAVGAGVRGWRRPRPLAAAEPRPPSSPAPRSTPRWSPGRGADVGFVEQEAENAATNGTVIGPGTARVHAARRGVRPQRGHPRARPVRRVHPAERGQRDHRALQHPGRADRRRHHRAARRHGQRPATADHDAHLAVRVAVQPVPVLQRPERRPAAPGLVDHRVLAACRTQTTPDAGDHHAVPPQPLLRRAAAAARPHLPGRRQDPADGPGRQRASRPPSTCSTRSWSPPPKVDLVAAERAGLRRRPDRPARLRRRHRPGHRLRQGSPPARSTSRRARTR